MGPARFRCATLLDYHVQSGLFSITDYTLVATASFDNHYPVDIVDSFCHRRVSEPSCNEVHDFCCLRPNHFKNAKTSTLLLGGEHVKRLAAIPRIMPC